MHLYKEQFSSSHDYPLIDKPTKILIIASTGRCGSHMLGHALHETGCFGFPLEYVNPVNLAEWKRRFEIDDFFEVLTEIQKRRTSTNGVFGIKIHYPHIKQFGGFSHLDDFFPNAYYILLSRKNVLRQAVSLSLAKQTGVWISGQKPINDHPEYDFKHIEKCLRETILNNSSWRYKLATGGCDYIEMNFDTICNDLPQSIKEIARFMDVKLDLNNLPEKHVTKKQSNDKKTEWADRFISEFDRNNELINDNSHGFLNTIEYKLKRVFKHIF